MKRTMSASMLGFLLCLAGVLPALSQDVSSSPSSLSFSNTYVGKYTGSKVLTITNIQKSGAAIINTVGFSCAGYGITSGVAPTSLGKPGDITHYSIFFQPGAVGTYDCNFVITMADSTVVNVPLTGTALAPQSTISTSPTSLTFSNQKLGSTSTAQTFTITNTGTKSINLNTITTEPPDFTVSPVTLPYAIAGGASLTLSVTYSPSLVTSENGAVDLDFNEVPDQGVSLTGNGIAATSLSIATFSVLPQATVSAAYSATLKTSAGTGPFTWNMLKGTSLPTGLSLSSTGVISGTVASSVAPGTYSFSIQVKGSKPNTITKAFTLAVYANLGDACNNISFDVPNTSTPMVDLVSLGTGTYQGYEGGLYPNGSNVDPSPHYTDGLAFADGIQPLDANGTVDPTNGKEVLLAIGESTAQNEFNSFLPIAVADPARNPKLVIVNGAQGGATPNEFVSSGSYYWSTILNNYLPQNGVTANQVVAIWIEDTDSIKTGSFPSDMTQMQGEYETMMQDFLTNFPNVKLVYWSSRVYGGYSNGLVNPDDPEPYAFEAGYAVKDAIADQINGAANLNYNPSNGPVLAPWMGWGPYYWSNGMTPNSQGLVWDCEDFSSDGTHPSATFGQLKVANALLNFLRTDPTATPWYLAPVADEKAEK